MGGVLKNTFIVGATQVAAGSISEAMLAAEACSAAKMKKEGTATHVLTSNGAGAVPSYQVIPAGTQDIVKIEVVTLGGAATSFTSAAITGNTYAGYIVEINAINSGSANSAVGLVINSDTTAGQYISNTFDVADATATGDDRSLGYFELQGSANPAANDVINGVLHINNPATGTLYRSLHWRGCNMTSTPTMRNSISSNGIWKSTSDISTLSFKGAANWAAGSTMTIWGLKK